MISVLLVTYTTAWGKDTKCHTGQHRDCTEEQSEPLGAVGGGLCNIEMMKWPWLAWEDVIGVFG